MKNASRTLIAKRYATALFEAAAEAKAPAGQQAAILAQADTLAAALRADDAAQSLANPAYTRAQRLQLAVTLAKAVGAHKLLAGTLAVLAENNRLADLPATLAELDSLAQTASGVVAVRIETATPLTDAQKVQLKVQLKAYTKSANISLTEVANPHLLGGFRAFFSGMVWEQSVRGRLARLSNALLSNIHNSNYAAK